MRILLLYILVMLALSGCRHDLLTGGSGNGSTGLDPDVPPVTNGNWYQPPVFASWQWQLDGVVNTTYTVDIYDIDLFDSSTALIQQLQATGIRVICYFSAGTYENWRADAADFRENELGKLVDGWPDERWLDIRSGNVQTIMKNRLDLARDKGCDGVEPDNMDGYLNNSGFDLTVIDQLAFNRFIANEAHTRELSVGLKNDLEQITGLLEYFDFAVNEQCFEFSECDLLDPFINAGKAVLSAEYRQLCVNDGLARDIMCTRSVNKQFSTLVLPEALDDEFRFSCL